jgi:hypothetical protein
MYTIFSNKDSIFLYMYLKNTCIYFESIFEIHIFFDIQVSQKWRTNYLLPYRGCLNVHEKNMEKMFPTKKSIIFIIIINDNTM